MPSNRSLWYIRQSEAVTHSWLTDISPPLGIPVQTIPTKASCIGLSLITNHYGRLWPPIKGENLPDFPDKLMWISQAGQTLTLYTLFLLTTTWVTQGQDESSPCNQAGAVCSTGENLSSTAVWAAKLWWFPSCASEPVAARRGSLRLRFNHPSTWYSPVIMWCLGKLWHLEQLFCKLNSGNLNKLLEKETKEVKNTCFKTETVWLISRLPLINS